MYQYIATVYQSIRQGQEVKNIRKDLKKGPTKELTIHQQQEFWLPGSYLPEKRQRNKKGKRLQPVYYTVCTKKYMVCGMGA